MEQQVATFFREQEILLKSLFISSLEAGVEILTMKKPFKIVIKGHHQVLEPWVQQQLAQLLLEREYCQATKIIILKIGKKYT